LTLLIVLALGHASPSWAGPFDANPQHPWNRLHDFFFIRTAADGFTYRRVELEPPFQALSKFLLDGSSHEQAIALLDQFLDGRADQLIASPLKRAILQRDLWAVFGTSAGTASLHWWQISGQLVSAGFDDTGDAHFGRKEARRALQKRLVAVMRRLALTPEEIAALPDNLAEAVRSGKFAEAFDPTHADRPFLPKDLLASQGPWVPVSNKTRADGLAAPIHVQFTNGRSLFLVLLHVPPNRAATDSFLAKVGNETLDRLPDETHAGLVRRTLLIDNGGNLCVSPLTEEVQFRVFGHDGAVNSYELLLDRQALFAGGGGFRAVPAGEISYYDISGFHGGSPNGTKDLLEIRPRPKGLSVMDCCITCHRLHTESSLPSIATAFAGSGRNPDLHPTTLEAQAQSAINWTRKSYSWGLLQGLWEGQR
jgi:hypothetical protein